MKFALLLFSVLVGNAQAIILEDCRAAASAVVGGDRFSRVQVPELATKSTVTDLDGVAKAGDRLRFSESKSTIKPGTTVATSHVTYFPTTESPEVVLRGDAQTSLVERNGRRRIELSRVFLDESLESDKETVVIPKTVSLAKSGADPETMRTSVLVNLRLIKALMGEDCRGKANEFVLSEVVNFESIAQLHFLEKEWMKKHGGRAPSQAQRLEFLKTTRIYTYALAVIQETGHNVKSVSLTMGRRRQFKQLVIDPSSPDADKNDPIYERKVRNFKMLEKLRQDYKAKGIEVSADEFLESGFSVVFDVGPDSVL